MLQASLASLDDTDLETLVRQECADLLGITAPPELVRIHRHVQAMPQYRVGHVARVDIIEARLSKYHGLAVAGSAYRGVGIPDSIHSGETAAETVMAALEHTPARPGLAAAAPSG